MSRRSRVLDKPFKLTLEFASPAKQEEMRAFYLVFDRSFGGAPHPDPKTDRDVLTAARAIVRLIKRQVKSKEARK